MCVPQYSQVWQGHYAGRATCTQLWKKTVQRMHCICINLATTMSTKALKMTARNIFDIKWNYRVLLNCSTPSLHHHQIQAMKCNLTSVIWHNYAVFYRYSTIAACSLGKSHTCMSGMISRLECDHIPSSGIGWGTIGTPFSPLLYTMVQRSGGKGVRPSLILEMIICHRLSKKYTSSQFWCNVRSASSLISFWTAKCPYFELDHF